MSGTGGLRKGENVHNDPKWAAKNANINNTNLNAFRLKINCMADQRTELE